MLRPPARPTEGAEAQLFSEPPSARRRSSCSRSRRRQLSGRGSAAERGCSARRPATPGGGGRGGGWVAGSGAAAQDVPGHFLTGWHRALGGLARPSPPPPCSCLAGARSESAVPAGVEAREGVLATNELIAVRYAADRPERPQGAAFLRVAALPLDLRSCTYALVLLLSVPHRVVRPSARGACPSARGPPHFLFALKFSSS